LTITEDRKAIQSHDKVTTKLLQSFYQISKATTTTTTTPRQQSDYKDR